MSAVFTDANFDNEVLNSGKLSIVDFWATWCPPCIAIGPSIDALATDFEGQVNVGKLNADENPQVSLKYGVTNLPCVLFIYNGEVVDKVVGVASKAAYQQRVRKLLEVYA
ncbi:MAG: thioredoxin [Chitinophagaceae bacterium]|nr:thioredoxin [Chitinophagaceae bacterium]MCB9044791.1 thioredoxin [Chitinophagales bacterium]